VFLFFLYNRRLYPTSGDIATQSSELPLFRLRYVVISLKNIQLHRLALDGGRGAWTLAYLNFKYHTSSTPFLWDGIAKSHFLCIKFALHRSLGNTVHCLNIALMGDSAAKRKRFNKALRTTEGIRNKELRIKNKRFQSIRNRVFRCIQFDWCFRGYSVMQILCTKWDFVSSKYLPRENAIKTYITGRIISLKSWSREDW